LNGNGRLILLRSAGRAGCELLILAREFLVSSHEAALRPEELLDPSHEARILGRESLALGDQIGSRALELLGALMESSNLTLELLDVILSGRLVHELELCFRPFEPTLAMRTSREVAVRLGILEEPEGGIVDLLRDEALLLHLLPHLPSS